MPKQHFNFPTSFRCTLTPHIGSSCLYLFLHVRCAFSILLLFVVVVGFAVCCLFFFLFLPPCVCVSVHCTLRTVDFSLLCSNFFRWPFFLLSLAALQFQLFMCFMYCDFNFMNNFRPSTATNTIVSFESNAAAEAATAIKPSLEYSLCVCAERLHQTSDDSRSLITLYDEKLLRIEFVDGYTNKLSVARACFHFILYVIFIWYGGR